MPTLFEMMDAITKKPQSQTLNRGVLAVKVPAYWEPGKPADAIDLGCKVWDVMSGLKDVVEGVALIARAGPAAKMSFDAARGAASAGGFALEGGVGMLALELLGPLSAWVQMWIGLGGPYLDARKYIAEKEARSGVSLGIVTAAAGESGTLVRERLGRVFQPKNNWDENNTALAKNSYNYALIAGYVEGRRLTMPQQKVFWRGLGSKMTNISSYSHPERWSRNEWISFYIDAATTYQRHFLK